MCCLSGVSRSSFERRPRPESEWETSARQAMRQVALECPAYGYRRVLAELKRRGWQYASQLYVQRLKDHEIVISMSRKGNPYDNAFAESFIKTLKADEVYCNEYETLQQAQAGIGHFLEFVYNAKRLHSALGYRPPEEFEAAFAAQQAAAAGSQARTGDGAAAGDALAVGDAPRI